MALGIGLCALFYQLAGALWTDSPDEADNTPQHPDPDPQPDNAGTPSTAFERLLGGRRAWR